jgi:hypothetical protein
VRQAVIAASAKTRRNGAPNARRQVLCDQPPRNEQRIYLDGNVPPAPTAGVGPTLVRARRALLRSAARGASMMSRTIVTYRLMVPLGGAVGPLCLLSPEGASN